MSQSSSEMHICTTAGSRLWEHKAAAEAYVECMVKQSPAYFLFKVVVPPPTLCLSGHLLNVKTAAQR